jgi:hypothetical protein
VTATRTASTDDDRAAQFLFWCARWTVDAAAAGPAPVDGLSHREWARVMTEGARHSMLPLVWRASSGVAGVPGLISADLETFAAEHTRRTLRLTGELLLILRRLDAAGIVAIPWKGPLLAQRAYGDLRARSFFDLDILLDRRDLGPARDLLLASGFRTEKPMTRAQQDVYVDHQGELELVRDEDDLWLELHWAVVPTYYAPPADDAGMISRRTTARLLRAEVPALAVEDELEALCVHGSKHRWERLLWVVDIAMLAQRERLDWDLLLGRSRSQGNGRMVALGLLLAESVVGARFPDAMIAALRQDGVAVALAREAKRLLFVEPDTRPDPFLFHARMRERTRDQARYLWNAMFTPSGADWGTVALPRPLFALYSVARPFRLAAKFGRRQLRRRDATADGGG